MNTAAIRQQLHEYIEQVDDRKIEGLYLFVSDEINSHHITLSAEQLHVLDEERQKHLNGESPSYSWQQARSIITDKQP